MSMAVVAAVFPGAPSLTYSSPQATTSGHQGKSAAKGSCPVDYSELPLAGETKGTWLHPSYLRQIWQ